MRGGPIWWQAKTQMVVALSTLEAEFIACSDATQEAIWLRELQKGILGRDKGPIEIHCHNQGALKLIDTGIAKAKTKDIDIKYHHVHNKQKVQRTVKLWYINSADNTTDLLMKALPLEWHQRLTKMTGLGNIQ